MFGFKKRDKTHYTYADLKVISDVSESLLSNLDLPSLLQNAVDRVVTRYKLLGGILLLKEKEELYAITISQGQVARKFLNLVNLPVSKLRIGLIEGRGNSIVESVVKNETIIGDDLNDFTLGVLDKKVTDVAKRATGTKSCMSLPIEYKGEVLGAFFLSKNKISKFTHEMPIFEVFANQMAIAITNARLYDASRKQVKLLEEKNLEIVAARRRERDMIDIMGHELRTPLSIIKMSVGLLTEKLSKNKVTIEDYQKYLERMNEALAREVRLLEAMLSSTKLEAEKMEMHFEQVDFDKIISDSILAMGGKASRKGIAIEYKPIKKPFYVYADSVRLAEVIDNLLLNAIKYTERGSVTISTSMEKENGKISIKDTGIGIPDADIPHLGEKFYRVGQYSNEVGNNDKRQKLEENQLELVRPGGTGLGLFVSYNLVNLMGGKLEVESKLGVGSTFSFTVPLYNNQPETYSGKNEERNIFKRLGFTQKKR